MLDKHTMDKLIGFMKNPLLLVGTLGHRGFFNWLDDEHYLMLLWRVKFKKKLDLNNPQSFNEKLQWLKLNDRNPLYTQMVDKYEAKKYVADRLSDKYIIPTLGVYEKYDDIDFNILPRQFVLKVTNNSGGVILCKNKEKFDFIKAKRRINRWMRYNYYWGNREWPYKNIKPRIIAEKYLEETEKLADSMEMKVNELIDYKLMCFNGKVKCSFVCTERYSEDGLKVTFFDRDWKRMPFIRKYPSSNFDIPKPRNYDLMIELAEKLSFNIPFLRVDFYEVGNQVYFGEATFYPGSGYEKFEPVEWDYLLGSWIEIG